jgi:hypothetical protein
VTKLGDSSLYYILPAASSRLHLLDEGALVTETETEAEMEPLLRVGHIYYDSEI